MGKRRASDEVSGWAESSADAEGAASSGSGTFDLESFISANLAVRRPKQPWNDGGHKWELETCPFNPEHTGGCAVVTRAATGVIGFKCHHNGCADKHWRDVRALYEGHHGAKAGASPGKAPLQPPTTISGAELFDRQAAEVPILLRVSGRPVMADGLCLFAAAQKAGKSWLALQIAIAVAGGPQVEGLEVLEHGPVLYGALEEPAARTASRIRQLAPNGGEWLKNLHFFYDLMPLMGGGAEQLEEMIQARNPRLVVLDTLTALVKGGKGNNSDVFRSQYAEVTRVRQLGETYHCGLLMPHHTRKGLGDGVIESIAGTGGISAAADTVWRLRRKTEGGAVLEVVGREVEECSFGMQFGREDSFGWRFEPEVLEAALGAERREILDLLREEGGMTPKAIAADLGKNRGAIRGLLRRMFSDGLVSKQGGKYFPTLSNSNSSNRESEDMENQ